MGFKVSIYWRKTRRKVEQLQVMVQRRLSIIMFVLLFLMMAMLPSIAHIEKKSLAQASPNTEDLVKQGRSLYEADRFNDALKVLQQAAAAFANSGDKTGQAMTLSNLSLTYQQLGLWTEAEESIIKSINLLQSLEKSPDNSEILAQALDVQGGLQVAQGKTEDALNTWQKAADIYQQIDLQAKLTRNRINTAQALQVLGFYRRAENILKEVKQNLQNLPDTSVKATGMRSLGDVLRLVGNLSESENVLKESLKLADSLGSNQTISEIFVSLGKTAHTQKNLQAALDYFQKAIALSPSTSTRIDLLLNRLSLLLETKQFSTAVDFLPQIQGEISKLTPSRMAVYARINLVHSLVKLKQSNTKETPSWLDIAQILTSGIEQAKQLQDQRAESYVTGTLGWLYEKTGQFSDAFALTKKALLTAQSINASDITYQWKWQIGRILKANKNIKPKDLKNAIAYYSQALQNLQSLRRDLATVNPDIQFDFRESVEPVYREYVELLLRTQGNTQASNENLKKARQVIESLQLAQLDNFFRSACLTDKVSIDRTVDKEDMMAAVIYPIILPDRLEVILKLPGQDNLRQYTTWVPKEELESTIEQLREDIQELKVAQDKQSRFRKVYDWLVGPAETDLQNSKIETLVFVLNGYLGNIPPAALYDGKQYLVEKYNIAINPSLQLFGVKQLQQGKFRALTAGLSQTRFNFPKLNYVESELQKIESEVPSKVLLNQEFSKKVFQKQVNSQTFPIVHLATHGQFSSNPDETFILAYDGKIKFHDLNQLLKTRDETQPDLIDLLVLSACQTAVGDERATLGIAGLAVRAGARSTLASLWKVNDASTAMLMSQFYQELTKDNVTKAQALHRAQLWLLKQEKYDLEAPYYWAAYILVGNWL